MLIDLVYSTTIWLNAFPPKDGISSHLSPRNIITSITFDYNKHCRAQFGSYVQTHEEPPTTSTMQACTLGAICLGSTGNFQGSYKFLNIRTGQCITRRKWTDLPMPQEVIDRVNELGKANGQPELLTFYDHKGRLIGETENPGVSEPIDTMIPPDDGLGDLNTPTVNQDYGLLEEQDTDQPLS
jgi:hypothetical protein